MSPEVAHVVETIATLLVGALTTYVRQLVKSRVTQGARIGELEMRVAYLEGHVRARSGTLGPHDDTPVDRPPRR